MNEICYSYLLTRPYAFWSLLSPAFRKLLKLGGLRRRRLIRPTRNAHIRELKADKTWLKYASDVDFMTLHPSKHILLREMLQLLIPTINRMPMFAHIPEMRQDGVLFRVPENRRSFCSYQLSRRSFDRISDYFFASSALCRILMASIAVLIASSTPTLATMGASS